MILISISFPPTFAPSSYFALDLKYIPSFPLENWTLDESSRFYRNLPIFVKNVTRGLCVGHTHVFVTQYTYVSVKSLKVSAWCNSVDFTNESDDNSELKEGGGGKKEEKSREWTGEEGNDNSLLHTRRLKQNRVRCLDFWIASDTKKSGFFFCPL